LLQALWELAHASAGRPPARDPGEAAPTLAVPDHGLSSDRRSRSRSRQRDRGCTGRVPTTGWARIRRAFGSASLRGDAPSRCRGISARWRNCRSPRLLSASGARQQRSRATSVTDGEKARAGQSPLSGRLSRLRCVPGSRATATATPTRCAGGASDTRSRPLCRSHENSDTPSPSNPTPLDRTIISHQRELIAYRAGWTDPERQPPVGGSGRHEPRCLYANDAELDRALADPDTLWTRPPHRPPAAALVLDPTGVTRTKALGSERMHPEADYRTCWTARSRKNKREGGAWASVPRPCVAGAGGRRGSGLRGGGFYRDRDRCHHRLDPDHPRRFGCRNQLHRHRRRILRR